MPSHLPRFMMPEHVHVMLLPRDENYRVASFLKRIKQPLACISHQVFGR
jgi:hypothetical protein